MRLKNHPHVFLRRITLALGLFAGFLRVLAADGNQPLDLSEKDIKAAILSKIPPYITWPAHKQIDESEKLILGIFGKDTELETLLQGLLKAQPTNATPCAVQSVGSAEDVSRCHIIFIPRSENEHWRRLLSENVDIRGLLTIGETDNFVSLGYVFNLNLPAKKKLEISLKNAKNARLLVKPKLLQLGNVVR